MKIALIIPCYNEEKRLALDVFSSFLRNYPEYHLCFVNDGSTDNTQKKLEEFCHHHLNSEVLNPEKNQGKAMAIREGMLHLADSHFDFIGYADADLATPLTEFLYLTEVLKTKSHVLCVMGARVGLLGREVKRKLVRHYLGRIFATCASLILKLHVYDTQCGAKLFRREHLFEIFQNPFITKWLFDIEVLFRIKMLKKENFTPEKIYEFPLTEWHDISGSKLKVSDFIKAPLELLSIYLHYR